MSSENNKPSNDPLETAIAAMKSATAANDRPPAALVAATIEALRRLEAGSQTAASSESRPEGISLSERSVAPQAAATARRQSGRYRRLIVWGAALAAAALIAIVIKWPTQLSPIPSGDERHIGPIVVIDVNPEPTFERLDNQIAQAQVDAVALLDKAKERLAAEQITRILADDSKLVASSQTN
jgi:hypothetical protein